MKLISLNTWAGRAGREKLLDFFAQHRDVDIFCLQEVWEGGHHHAPQWGENMVTTLLTEISATLPGYTPFFRPNYHTWWGLAIFAKNGLQIQAEGERFVHKRKEDAPADDKTNHARNIQYMTIGTANGPRTVINFHGLWSGGGKEDTVERLIQSDNIIAFAKELDHPYVLCGDFNLLPNTTSMKKLENLGLRNLITEFGVTSTRSRHYTRTEHQFADYALVSEGIRVNKFAVLPEEISDHLPIYLDFN